MSLRVDVDGRRQRRAALAEDPTADIRLRGEEHGRAGRVRIERGFDGGELPRYVRLLREQQDARRAVELRRDGGQQCEELLGDLLAHAATDSREELHQAGVTAVRRDAFDQLPREQLWPAPDVGHDLRGRQVDAVRRLEGPQQPAVRTASL